MLLVIKTKHSDNNTIKHRNNRHIIFKDKKYSRHKKKDRNWYYHQKYNLIKQFLII